MTRVKATKKPKTSKPKNLGGRPVTTGSWSTPLISFRAPSKAAYDQLAAEAKAADTSPNLLAKARVFPSEK